MTSIAQAVAPAYQSLEILAFRMADWALRATGVKSDGKLIDLDGDGLADYEEPPGAFTYYLKGISAWLFIWFITQVVFAIGYTALEPALDFGSAFYLCIVTATTVGYGDIGVSDEPWRKMYASVHILYSVSSLAALLNTVQVLWSERQIQIRKSRLLERQLDTDLIQSLDKDNNGLDKLEFVVGMLTKLEILHWDDVEPFLAQFDALDKDKSGRLDKNDLLRMVEENKAKVEQKRLRLEALKRKNLAEGDGGTSPNASRPHTPAAADAVDSVEAFDDDLEGGALKPSKLGLDGEDGDDDDAAGAAVSSEASTYGGIGRRNRELAAAGADQQAGACHDGDPARRGKRGLGLASGLPQQLLAGVRRPRRPRHLRGGKVNPT